MPYNPSSSSKKHLHRIIQDGKEKSLVPPEFKPLMQRILEPIGLISLFSSIPMAWYNGIYFSVPGILGYFIISIIVDLFIQDDHALVRIYGPLGRLRYIFEEAFRDKYLQYFNETNSDGRPIPRIVRDYIYQKAHNIKPVSSFGTELDIHDPEITTHSRILHRNFPGKIISTSYSVSVGEKRKNIKPFIIKNTINISGMSYGALNYRAAESLSIGAKDVAYVNTGEGGYGPHGISGNDIVFQIGTGKFGVGKNAPAHDGTETRVLDEELLRSLVRDNPNIRMIQLKISQGAKPGLGGVLPGDKVTPDIAEVRKVAVGKTVYSPAQHTEIIAGSPKESILKLMDFIERIRVITELPVGIKLCVGRLEEIDLLAMAMQSTGKGPDAIQLDGADGGTGAGPNLFMNYVGYGGAVETAFYTDKKLKEYGVRDNTVISVSGRIFSPAHAALAFAAGADTIETARGAMLALGCIQALKCHTNHCPSGITTHDPWRVRGLDVPEKSTRVHHYLKGFHEDMIQITKVLGHTDPRDINPADLRLMSFKDSFQDFFSDDPFGFRISREYEL
ncbi:MAG TPA: FMN-binding glutamate synthase family protein [Leptospiraceae bacterium]|nr:FMN-binding glutamate synthase family protein [Leptospiraceae bacterium]HNF24614.1 FMN-binding glutamate synthase family protein [Leptospiraceae bacterium]HNN03913.1 FMN-binding glutamate synthase family protein [Leptospiraceae bacterium]